MNFSMYVTAQSSFRGVEALLRLSDLAKNDYKKLSD